MLENVYIGVKLAIFVLFRVFYRKIFSNIANIIKNFSIKPIKKSLKNERQFNQCRRSLGNLVKKFCFVLGLNATLFFASTAKSPEQIIYKYSEVPTEINYYPFLKNFGFEDDSIKEWNKTNNLRRKSGSAFFAIGEPLLVEGYVKDINNIPIEGVLIRVIQANANGVYNYLVGPLDALYDSNFSSTGIAITDNRGYYSFYTVFPGHYNRRAPHIHFHFDHPLYGEIETEMFFKNHPRNRTDWKYRVLTPHQREIITADIFLLNPKNKEAGKRALFNITYNANQPTKEM